MHVRYTIPTTADRVWKILADFGGIAHWSPDLAMSTQIARNGIAVGAVRELVFTKPVGKIHSIRERIVQCGDHWYTYELDGGIGHFGRAGSTWRVIDDGPHCVVEVTSFMEDGPWWAMALRPLTYKQLERGVKRALRGLTTKAMKAPAN